jgi:predicted metal-dependent peptidase
MTRHSGRASRALRALNETDPAVAALALWCEHRDCAAGPVAETEGAVIRYGPGFADLPAHEQPGLAAHHVLHVALRHGPRMAEMALRLGERFDAELFNHCADAIVNEALLQAGHALPRPALVLTGMLAAAGQPASGAAEALAEWDVERLFLRLVRGGRGEGSAAEAALAHAKARGGGRDLRPAPGGDGRSEGSAAAEPGEAARWRQHLARAMDGGRRAGRGIGRLGGRLADLQPPPTPWEVLLRGFLARALIEAPGQTHRRPAHAWIAAEALARDRGGPVPAFQPGRRRQDDAPRLAIAVDASGSIDDARLGLFMAEVTGIARRCRAELHLIQFDDGLRAQVRLDPATWAAQLAALPAARDGGTDFAPPVAAAVALDASALVLLTDLDGPFGPAPRGLPVIWAVPEPPPAPPPFGRLLDLSR